MAQPATAVSGVLAGLLRTWRELALLTQEELASRAGLSVGTIRGLESGRIRRPRAGSVRLLADALGLTDVDRTLLIAASRGDPVELVVDREAHFGIPPAQLPADLAGFTGRADALKLLDELPTATEAAPVAISVVVGPAGVGKTTLAIHWAHQVAYRFPDGQLYVNLRGFDPAASPLEPAVVVRGFLDAFAVPPQRVPATPESQAALYRSLLSGRRVLVVLDNARDAEQVRPLLPAAAGCVAVVTSRDQLTGLIVAEGARPLVLDLFHSTEARHMLERRLGAGRVAAEPHAAEEIIARCARLPLALAIVAARAGTRPGVPLASVAAGLHDTHASLDAFTSPDTATDVRAVFSWSYHNLSELAARLFRLLGLHPGPHITAPAAASLAATSPQVARALLAELVAAHLVSEHSTERYAVHDLLHAYATELVNATDTAEDRSSAVHRLLDHYLHTTYAAALLLQPNRDTITPRPAIAGAALELPANQAQARVWFTAEYPVLLAAIWHAAATGFDVHAWQLAWTLVGHCEHQGLWHDQAAVQRVALDAARRSADRLGQANAHRDLGGAYARLDLPYDAHPQLLHALALFGEIGDRTGQARTHLRLAWVCYRLGHHTEAFRHDQHALDLYRATGDPAGQARALNNIGWIHALLGRHDQAIGCCQQALTLHQNVGDRAGEANTWDSLGFAHHHLGQHDEAIACYQRAVGLFQQTGDRYFEADTLSHLGDAQHTADDPDAAREAWQHALTILDEFDHPDADQVRTKLHDLDHPSHRTNGAR